MHLASFLRNRVAPTIGLIALIAAGTGDGGLAADGGSTDAPMIPTNCPSDVPLASGMIATIAGGGSAAPGDGPAISARIEATVGGLAVDQAGAVHFTGYYGDTIWRIDTDGALSAFASPETGVPLIRPGALAFDHDGGLLVTDSFRIWRLTPDGSATSIAGTGVEGSDGDGGPAVEALINATAIGVGPDGDIYVDDMDRFRTIDAAGMIHAFAGTGVTGFAGDGGPALDAQFEGSIGSAADATGDVYLAETSGQRIRRVDGTGVITTFAGSGVRDYSGDGGPALDAAMNDPVTLAVGADGSVYVSDHHNHAIRRIDPAGIITTVAGTGRAGYSGDCGPAGEAQLNQPWGIAVRDGVLYIVDMGNQRIRMVVL